MLLAKNVCATNVYATVEERRFQRRVKPLKSIKASAPVHAIIGGKRSGPRLGRAACEPWVDALSRLLISRPIILPDHRPTGSNPLHPSSRTRALAHSALPQLRA